MTKPNVNFGKGLFVEDCHFGASGGRTRLYRRRGGAVLHHTPLSISLGYAHSTTPKACARQGLNSHSNRSRQRFLAPRTDAIETGELSIAAVGADARRVLPGRHRRSL